MNLNKINRKNLIRYGTIFTISLGVIFNFVLMNPLIVYVNAQPEEDITPPDLRDFYFTPTTIDVSEEDQEVFCTLRFTDGLSGFDYASIRISSPSEQIREVYISSFDRISGDAYDGIYRDKFIMPQYSEAGTWKVHFIDAYDNVRNRRFMWDDELYEQGFPIEFNVIGGPDLAPPVLRDFYFTPTTIDVSEEDQEVFCTLRFTDGLSGFDYASIRISSPSEQIREVYISSFDRISGDAYDGIYRDKFIMPQYSEAGTWKVHFIDAYDNVRNRRFMWDDELYEQGFPIEFNVNSFPEDITPPVLRDFYFTPTTIDVSEEDQEVFCTLRFTDGLSGFDYASIRISSPSEQIREVYISSFDRISGDAYDGIYRDKFIMPQYSEAGTWKVHFIDAYDNVRNRRFMWDDELYEQGFPIELFVVEFEFDQLPTCNIKLQENGIEISEINIGEFFDIYVGDSTDDFGIEQVRFSSDDEQDGIVTGVWTDWYDWVTTTGDWNVETKIKRWAFSTGGSKEVWAEVKDIEGQTDSDHSWITAASINLPPIVEFTFAPDKPIIGENVKFDASNSYDPDGGALVNYLWDFGDGNLEYSNTPYIEHPYNSEGVHQVKLRVWDDEGYISEIIKPVTVVTDWSYAIITDLHIGRGYPEYNGEVYYLIERLETAIQEIIDNKELNNVKFVMVLGDITESGNIKEFQKAKEILGKLNDPNGDGNTEDGLPYFPIIGNHDVHTSQEDDQGSWINFNNIFNLEFFELQFDLLGIEDSQWYLDSSIFVNYAFEIGNINLIGLDFVKDGSSAVLYEETMTWLTYWLERPGNKKNILVSHHPLVDIPVLDPSFIPFDFAFSESDIEKMESEISGWNNVEANFAGHVHGWYNPENEFEINFNANREYNPFIYDNPNDIKVITTEALMVGSNDKNPKGIIRVVEMQSTLIESKINNYQNLIGEFPAINPYFNFNPYITWELAGNILHVDFEIYAFNNLFRDLNSLAYKLEFGDGTDTFNLNYDGDLEIISHNYNYENELTDKSYSAHLKMIGLTSEGIKVIETINFTFKPPPEIIWRRYIQPGDILLHRGFSTDILFWTHAGIYVGDDKVVEANPDPPFGMGINEYHITGWDYPSDTCVSLLRVSTASPNQRLTAAEWALNQVNRIPKPLYTLHWYKKDTSALSEKWYCSELVWASYKNQGIDIDFDESLFFVSPDDIYLDSGDDIEEIGSHIEYIPEGDSILEIIGKCPIDLLITDPEGLYLSKNIFDIPYSYYLEGDLNRDGEIEDIVIIANRKEGEYLITVITETSALPDDTFNLEVLNEGVSFILAQNVQIKDISENPYIIESTDTKIIPIIPVSINFDPDTLNLACKGKWITVYIELPIGHGYDISDIDIRSILLNDQVSAVLKPNDLGDYDLDGIPDLMVKFDLLDIQEILQVGGEVSIIITGKLEDGRAFRGQDIIRVISHEEIVSEVEVSYLHSISSLSLIFAKYLTLQLVALVGIITTLVIMSKKRLISKL